MKTIHHLIQGLESHSFSESRNDVLYLMSRFNACQGEDWSNYTTAPGNTPLFQNEHFRLVLIYWEAFGRSKKHGHPEGGCLLKVLSGRLVETRFDPIDPKTVTGRHHFRRGDVSYIHDALAYHVVENPDPGPAVSLHIYSPGIHFSRVIQPEAQVGPAG